MQAPSDLLIWMNRVLQGLPLCTSCQYLLHCWRNINFVEHGDSMLLMVLRDSQMLSDAHATASDSCHQSIMPVANKARCRCLTLSTGVMRPPSGIVTATATLMCSLYVMPLPSAVHAAQVTKQISIITSSQGHGVINVFVNRSLCTAWVYHNEETYVHHLHAMKHVQLIT